MCGKIRKRNFHAHGSDLTAQWVAPWGRFCIFREGERGRGKNERQRGGGCAKPLRGQAPVTPNSLILRSFHLATRYKFKDFVERDPREMANLSESQIFIRVSAISASRLKAGARCRRQIDRPQIFKS